MRIIVYNVISTKKWFGKNCLKHSDSFYLKNSMTLYNTMVFFSMKLTFPLDQGMYHTVQEIMGIYILERIVN